MQEVEVFKDKEGDVLMQILMLGGSRLGNEVF